MAFFKSDEKDNSEYGYPDYCPEYPPEKTREEIFREKVDRLVKENADQP